MLHFCTYFDHRYLIYGLALYRSLIRRVVEPFTLHILCLDEVTFGRLQQFSLPHTRLIRLDDIERAYPDLLSARQNRRLVEYYFTLTPALPCYLLEQNPDIELLAYVDADLYFYSKPDPFYAELGGGSVLLVPHRQDNNQQGGTYNVGLVLFRNDETGRECLDWWRQRCLEWCYNRYENGRCADQGYLEDWPIRFPGVVVSEHKGVGLAPWNVARYTVSVRDRAVFVDSDPLVFYHFGDVRMGRRYLFTHTLPTYNTRLTPALKNMVYVPYVRELRAAADFAGIQPAPGLSSGQGRGAKEWLRRELFSARLLVVGPLIVELDYGRIGPLLGNIRRRLLA